MIHELSLLLSIDRSIKTPIYQQLCEKVRNLANTGRIEEGRLMPATRVLADALEVSRSTVITAYEQLVAEGYLEAQPGSGFTLSSTSNLELLNDDSTTNQTHIEHALILKPLTPSIPDMSLFPYQQWGKAVSKVCRTQPETMLTGSSSFGNFPLRQAIANHVKEWRGFDASPHQIIITAGATDALNICFKTLTKAGQTVGIEDPGYQPILNFIKNQGLKPAFLKVDKEGATLPQASLQKSLNPHAVILTPSHQFPLGAVMSPQRRRDYLHWANNNEAWIIEDDYDSEFRYAGRPIPAMMGFDTLNRTIYIGSFSKVFSNTLRLGYIIAPNSLVGSIRQTMDTFGLKAGLMPQQALANFMQSGEFYRHIRRIRKVYNGRRKYLIKQLQEKLNHFGYVDDHPAGMQLVFHLTAPLNDVTVVKRAKEKGFHFDALSQSAASNPGYNGFILGFCSYSEQEMDNAIDCLSHIIKTHPIHT